MKRSGFILSGSRTLTSILLQLPKLVPKPRVRPVGFDLGAADMRHVRAGHQIFAATGDAESGAVETGIDAAHDLHRIQVNLEN
jgi:hypothetical protein